MCSQPPPCPYYPSRPQEPKKIKKNVIGFLVVRVGFPIPIAKSG